MCPVDGLMEMVTSGEHSARVRATATIDRRRLGIRAPRLPVGSVVTLAVEAELRAPQASA